MGHLTQLGLLLKKNFILRKRSPGVVCLELVWPVLIVAIVALIRQGVPLGKRDTCHYQSRAMPSAGIVPFLQTFVCNLDNQCHSTYTLSRALETTYSVSKLTQQLAPTLSSDDVLEGLKSMNKGVEMMDVLIKLSNESDVLTGLDDMLILRNFFRNPDYVKKVLVQDYGIMGEEEVDAMLDATVNVTVIFELMGYPDFRSVACSPQKLGQFLILKPGKDINAVSRSLCNISVDKIPEMTEFLQREFDIAQLVRTMAQFERVKRRFGQAYTDELAFNDIADMIDLIMKSPTLMSTYTALSSLKQLPDLIRSLPGILAKIENLKYYDLSPLVRLVNMIDPIVEAYKPNDTIWYAVKYGVYLTAEISDLAQNRTQGTINEVVGRMLNSAEQISLAIQDIMGDMGQEVQMIMGALMKVDYTSIFDQLMNNTMNPQAAETGLMELQATLQQMPDVWNITAPVVMVTSKFLEMGTIIMEESNELLKEVTSMVNVAGPVQTSLTALFNKGPNVTMAVLTAFTDSKSLAKLFEADFHYQDFCNAVLSEVGNLTSVQEVAELRPIMCNDDITTDVNNLMTSLRLPQVQAIMNDTMKKMNNLFTYGVIPTGDANFTLLFRDIQRMTTSTSSFINIADATWRNIVSNFKLENVDLTLREWEPVLDRLDENYVMTGIMAMSRGFGLAMDNNMNPTIGRYVHIMSLYMKYMEMTLGSYVDLYSKESPLGELVQMMSTYAPELMPAMLTVARDPIQMTEILKTGDIMMSVCTFIRKLSVPSHVPLDTINTLVCDGLPKSVNNYMRVQQDMANLTQEIWMVYNYPEASYPVSHDWMEFMDYSERMVQMMSHPDQLMTITEGPVYLFNLMNLTMLEKGLGRVGDMMKDFGEKDVSSFLSISLSVMQQLDAGYQNDSSWNYVKHIVLVYNSYLKMVNTYYRGITESTGLSEVIQKFYPANLQNYINRMAAITPDFFNAMTNAVLNPDKLIKKFLESLTGNLAPDCSSQWVTDFLLVPPNTPLRDFEQMTCSINWTAMALDIMNFDPNLKDFSDQLGLISSQGYALPRAYVNWTEVIVNTQDYVQYLASQDLYNLPSTYSLAPFNVSAIDMRWTDFLHAVQTLQNIDMQKVTDIMTSLQTSLQSLGMGGPSGNSTVETDFIIQSLYGQLYITHHLMVFGNKVLTYFNTHNPVNLLDMMGSDELRRNVRLTEMMPQLTEIGMDSLITYMLDPSKLSVFLNMQDFMMQLCTNMTVFGEVFDLRRVTSDPGSIQSALCSAVNLNYTVVYEQFLQNWDGFADLMNTINKLATDQVSESELQIDPSVIINDQNTLSELINQTMFNMPTIVFTTNNDWMNETIYASQWENFLHQLNATFEKYMDHQFLVTWQESVTKLFTSTWMSIPGFRDALPYMDAVLDLLQKSMEQSFGGESPEVAFQDYPNLSRMLGLVQDIPEAFLVFSYTDIMHPELQARWSAVMTSWETFCSADTTQLFATPPGVSFRMENFLASMCNINITALATEMAQYDGTDKLNTLLMYPYNNTVQVNISEVAHKMAVLIETITQATTQPITTNAWNLRIFDENIWMNVINKLGEYANSSIYMTGEKLGETLTQTMISSFQAVPGFNTVLSYMDVILDIFYNQVQRSLQSLPEALKDFPNMNQIFELLNDLPNVIEVVAYTNLFTPDKVSRWTAAMQSWEGFCSTDVDTLMTVPPGRTFSIAAFIQSMCSVNITALTTEAERYEGSDRLAALINAGDNLPPVNTTAVVAKMNKIIALYSVNASNAVMTQSQPSVFNETIWQDVFARIARYGDESASSFSEAQFFGMAQDLLKSFQLGPEIVGVMDTTMATVEMVLDRILMMENDTSIMPLDVFPDAPQLQAMIDLLKQPGVIPVLMASLNSQKMMPLFAMTNMTEVFITLCYPGNDISQYLTVPPGVSIDIPLLQSSFCAVNVTLLEPEVNAAFEIARINNVGRGMETISWLQVGFKFQRVLRLLERWIATPPQLVLPPNWDNATYWLDILNTYNMARQTPEAINAEIENILRSMGPLLMQEPFREYGVVMQTVLRIINQNLVDIQNKTMTVTTMFNQIPVLRDVITALGLNADILETIMTAPVKNPEQFTNALLNPATDNYICTHPDMWRQLLVLPPSFDVTALTSAFCNSNTSVMVSNLVRNLNLQELLAGISNMTYMPNWEGIFQQSQELGQNIENLIRNPPIFKVNESLAILEQAYNQSNLWNLVVSYNVLSQAFGNSSEFGAVNGYMQGSAIVLNFINDIFQKMSVNGVTLDLGSLFSGSPTFTRLISTILHLSPDPLTGLSSVQLRPEQNVAFSMVAADPSKLAEVFCSEANFKHYFSVDQNFNLSSILPTLCSLNFTAMVGELDSNFMVSALINKLSTGVSQPLDLQKYIEAQLELNNKIMQLMGVQNVTFGDVNLAQAFTVNMTALMQVWERQQQNIYMDYQGYFTSLMSSLQESLGNTSDWRNIALSLRIFDLYLKNINNNFGAMSSAPLSMAMLTNSTELASLLLPLISSQQQQQVMQLQIKPEKLKELMQSPNVSTIICTSALWDAFVMPTTYQATIQYLQQQICAQGSPITIWQTIERVVQGFTFQQQLNYLVQEFQTGSSMVNLNITALSTDLATSIDQVTAFINSLATSVSPYSNTTTSVDTLNITQFSAQLATSMVTFVWSQLPDQQSANMMARIINTVKLVMTEVNNQLSQVKEEVTLQSLTQYQPQLLSLMEAYINLTKMGLQAWMDGNLHMDRVMQLALDMNVMTSRCQDGSVAQFISNTSTPGMVAMNLQTVLCTATTGLPQQLGQLINQQQITDQLTMIWNSTGPVMPDFAGLLAEAPRLNNILQRLSMMNIHLSNQLMNTFNMSSLISSFTNLASNPSMIFQMLKPFGVVMEQMIPEVDQIYAWMDTFTLLPVIKFLEMSRGYENAFMAAGSDPMQLLKVIAHMSDFNSQMEVNVELFSKPVFFNAGNDNFFRSTVLCNSSAMAAMFAPITTPAIEDILCNQPGADWISKLHQLGVGNMEIYSLAMKMYTARIIVAPQNCTGPVCSEDGSSCYSSCTYVNPVRYMEGDVSWMKVLTDMEKLTKLLMDPSTGGTDMSAIQQMTVLWNNMGGVVVQSLLKGAFGMVKLVDTSMDPNYPMPQWEAFKQMMQFVGSVNNYLNTWMNRFTDSPGQIFLQDIFPDPSRVAQLLTGVIGQDNAAEFLTASFNPVTFYERIAQPQTWEAMLCNYGDFSTTFTFPPGTNVAALQRAMCIMARNESSSLTQLLDLFGAGNILSEFEGMMSGSMGLTNYSMWDNVFNTTMRLLNNFGRLQQVNVNGTSVTEWFMPILASLEALQSGDLKSTETMCNEAVMYMRNTDIFQQAQPIIVQAVGYMKLAAEQMRLGGVIDDVICAMSRHLDLGKAIELLKTSGFWASIQQSNQLAMNTGNEALQCTAVVQTGSELFNAINSTLMGAGQTDWNMIGQCIQDSSLHFRTIVSGFDSILKVVSDLVPILGDKDLQVLLGNQEALAPALEYFLKIFSKERAMIVRFSDLFTKNSTVEQYLTEILRMSPEIVTSVLQSTVNLNATNFLSLPVEEIRDIICNATRLGTVLTLPNFTNADIPGLSRLLCTNMSMDTAAVLKSAAEAGNILNEILSVSATGLNQMFFNNISTHIFQLIGDLQSVSELAAIFSDGFNLDALKDNIPKIDRFLISSGPDRIVQSLTDILEDIRKVIPPSSEADVILREVDLFIRGFMGLDLVQSYFLKLLSVNDFIKDPARVYSYLVDVVEMDPDNARTVLEGVFSIQLFVNNSYLMESNIGCQAMFDKLIILNTTQLSMNQITNDLCRVNESVAVDIANMLIPDLTVGDLVKKYVTLSADDIFKSVNITASEVSNIATKLSNAQRDLLKAADILTGKSVTLRRKSNEILDELFNLPQAQTGPNTMGSVQPVLCGNNKPDNLVSGEFNVDSILAGGSKAVLAQEEIDELSQIDQKNGGDFCVKMYESIKNEKMGSIIWAYLKPIIRGKIIYTPDNDMTRSIIYQANSVFRTMARVKEVAEIWRDGAPNLMAMSAKAKEMGQLKDLLQDELVGSLLKQTAGLDTQDLLTGIDALDAGNFNSSSINGMRVAAELVVNYTSCMEMDRFVGVATEAELETEAYQLSKTNNFLAGIVFTNMPTPTGNRSKRATEELPKHVMYKIRMDLENVKATDRITARYWQPDPEANFAGDLQYFRGFLQLQDMVERAIVAVQTGDNTTLPGVYLKQFPFPCHTYDRYIGVLGSYLLPVVMTFAWLAAIAIATKNLVYDREQGQEQSLKIMGMRSFYNWFAWFVSTMLLMVIVSAILTMILKLSHLFNMTDPSIVFLYLICFCFSTTMLCYFVSAFFTRVTLAILMVLIVYFLSYLPYILLVSLEVNMTFWQKSLACLSSTSAFGFAAQYLARLEMQNVGLQWSNIATSPIVNDPMTFSWACYMMLIDSAIYLVLGWYIRTVKPGKYGIGQPWYFPVLPSYWCGSSHKNVEGASKQMPSQNVTLFEASTGGIPGMAVRNLTKRFGSKTVVDNISIDFNEGQVTALLGHNGAAKTTTMNMLIGILEQSSGEVFVNKKGKSGGIGYCPQHNTLLDYMTVMEHMELYAGIKCDWSSSEKTADIKRLLSDVDLYHVRDVRVGQLSGGMKRRLCVALAFVGGSTAIVLDEPTSGVDPAARKHIWNLIVKQRPGRTILLSTHHLDEADTVGDMVAVMHQGHILCAGSPIFLKEKLGGGYHLTLDKAVKHVDYDASHSGNQSSCSSSEVLAYIQSMLPQAQLVEEIGTELVFNLPREDSAHTPFANFFNQLDQNLDRLYISSYGVSDTTLEDVFLKVTTLADNNITLSEDVLEKERMKLTRQRAASTTDSDTTSETSSQETSINMSDSRQTRYSGLSLKLQQMSALLLKRFHHYRRNWRLLISILLLPTILFVASMGFAQIRPPTEDMPSLLMTPDLYAPNMYMFYKDSSPETMSDRMANAMVRKPGVGTACMEGFDSKLPNLKCDFKSRNFTSRVKAKNQNGGCVCEDQNQRCTPDSVDIPRHIGTPVGNYLQDLHNDKVPTYLLDSFDDYIEKRYGGWVYEPGPEGTDVDLATTVWYNNRGYHSSPAFFNAHSNSLLRAKMEQANQEPEKYGISLFNHPLAFHNQKLSFNSLGQQAADAGIALVFLLAFTFIPSAFIVFLVNENLNKEKQLQFISGVGSVLYWTTSFLWDMIVYSVTVAIAVAVLAIFQVGPYWERMNLPALVSLLFLYGWAILPMMYMTLKLFKSASSAYLILFCLNMLTGIISIISILCLVLFEAMGLPGVSTAYRICRYVFLIFPQFSLGQGLIDLTANHFKYSLFIRFGEDVYIDPFSFELLAWNLIALAIAGFVFFIITIIIESRRGSSTKIPRRLLDIHDEDDDVRNERNRIQMGHTKDDLLVINGLTKMYRRGLRKFLAVDNISFGVSKGECFGLLGVNGAGKTTTFKMLTGDTDPSSGEATLNGHRISMGNPSLGQEVGYCPQEGGLDEFLSGEELLFCHAKLKGISDQQAKNIVVDLVAKLKLGPYIQKAVKTYSGGTKRKLSLAIAMIGDPQVLFLDEPTTGMDPATRRLVWKCITKAGQQGQSIVLTSHSMDECDALSSRLAIMVNGRLMCLGSSQHLKTKFGDGYTVVMHTQGLSNTRHNIEQAFLARFPGAEVKDQHQSVLEVSIPRGATSVAELFNILQTAQNKNHIVRYSLSQTTLDTVFVNFAREQSDSLSDKDDGSTSEAVSDQSGMLSGPFTNQTYAYMNPEYQADPDDVRLQIPSQYAANLARASSSLTASFKGDKSEKPKSGTTNEAFSDDEKTFVTRL